MQLQNEFVIISKDISSDANDSMESIFKIIDNFNFAIKADEYQKVSAQNADGRVVFPVAYVMATSWRSQQPAAKDTAFTISIELIDPAGVKLSEMIQEAMIAKGNDRIRFNINTQGMPVTKSGQYQFKVKAIDTAGKVLSTGDTVIKVELKIEK